MPPDVILRLKCTVFDFGCNSVPDPAGGAHSAFPQLYLRGRTSNTRKGKERGKGRREANIKAKEGKGKREREGKGREGQLKNSGYGLAYF